eukprot:TRINITY_DN12976_c0_g1_i1.p1 TRINITY_DN12976_c0_g1~~TRINITY_DN12976_c0_g1_i1.p1  ORF type:complete len:273 (+),score=34.49 TRINITY_DN12976_c0_g1_i1:104-922(+)
MEAPLLEVLAASWQKQGDEFLMYLGVQAVSFAIVLLISKCLWPKHKDHWALADTLQSSVIYPVMAYLAVKASLELIIDVKLRWRGVTETSNALVMLYVTRTILHLGMQVMQEMNWLLFVLMSIHHVLSLLCFGNGLVRGHMHFWGCMAGVCEITTVFLNNVWLFKEISISGRTLQSYTPGWIYSLNGLLLWLGFVVFRLALFPYWLWLFYRDVTDAPQLTWNISSSFERYAYAGVIVFMLSLSSYWMIPITKGLLKALGLLSNWDDSVKKVD